MTKNHHLKGSKWKTVWKTVVHHVREEWRTTVFVTALVAVAHLGFNWLSPIDNYALLVLGNKSLYAGYFKQGLVESRRVPVLSLAIDGSAYEALYREKAPIDRCKLEWQLKAIYDAHPDVVVVDIDLSPFLAEIEPTEVDKKQRDCEERIYNFLKFETPTRTVLLVPFLNEGSASAGERILWMAEMQQKNVAFGSGDVPVSYGMTNTYFSSGDTLSGAVEKILGMTSRSRNHDDSMDDGYVRVIDPRTYGHGMKAKTIQAGMSREVITGLVNDSLLLRPTPTDGFSPHRVVFFGIGEGDVDTFLTPVGKIYGVELHAAAFASRDQPKWAHLASVVLDLLLAFLMGFWISYCWRRYYTYSTRMTTAHQQYAGAWALFMVAGVAGAVILAVWLSLWFMAFGIWLSPLPIAIGMFLEGCVTGPVTQACKELRASSARIGAHIQPAAPPSMAIKANIWRGVKICIWIGVVVWMVCLLIFH